MLPRPSTTFAYWHSLQPNGRKLAFYNLAGLRKVSYDTMHFWATVSKTVRPMLSVRCLSVLSVCLSVTLVYCGQTERPIKMKLGMQVGLGPGHIVLHGDPAPPPPGGAEPPVIYCGQTAGWIKMHLVWR